MHQRTLKREVVCAGTGLHTGQAVTMRIKPAPADSGIVFHRKDVGVDIPAHVENITNSTLATSLGVNGTSIQTVEHLLGALYGLGIHNVRIETDGPEIPAMDGSALPFVRMIMRAGIARQNRPKKLLIIREPIEISDNDAVVHLRPSLQPIFSFRISYPHPLLRHQALTVLLSSPHFKREISPARTFGFLDEYEDLKSRGLARGGSLDNAIVLDKSRVLNDEGLRFKDEFVRHKILDSMGDLSLLGFPVIGHLNAHKSGHRLHHMLLEKLLECKSHWTLIDPETISLDTNHRPIDELHIQPIPA
ncbi:MAG: UDP-3-O-acyl-N-acetylglucosamine deacetylase [Deltaproteobacteria bacterium]|nr:UDP-3-O-acyl-N-acetylglucosamine deacetylase [Deltaproteobacteria bacterium]MBW2308652.1 UDP-3-O-acyl-N-acetylglucosamine deacetylase [Deltaproteobacteria bacterium]